MGRKGFQVIRISIISCYDFAGAFSAEFNPISSMNILTSPFPIDVFKINFIFLVII